MRLIQKVALALGLSWVLSLSCFGAEAAQIPFHIRISQAGAPLSQLQDQNRATKLKFTQKSTTLTVSAMEKASYLYLVWDTYPQDGWRLEKSAGTARRQESGYLHELIALDQDVGLTDSFEITVLEHAVLCDVYLFGEGTLPDFVQDWSPPAEKADILLLPTHADDEHLYFGGIMPLYARNPDYTVQVAYMVNHNGEPYRPHELLNGLWAVGIRTYPIIPAFPDLFSDSLAHAKTIYAQEKIIAYQEELLLRFRPQVVIGHDLKGEYGHGAHMLNADSLLQAVEHAKGKGHDVAKVYLHLYPENAIILDLDQPLPQFGGKTAFEMAEAGFAQHQSQQKFFKVEKTGPYDLRKFGLFRSTVGPDTKNDLFENITSYGEQKRIEMQQAEEQAAAAAQAREQEAEATAISQQKQQEEQQAAAKEAATDKSRKRRGMVAIATGGVGCLFGAALGTRKRKVRKR